MERERSPAWSPDRILRVGAPLWILGGCLILVAYGNRGQPLVLTACLAAWGSMWIPYVVICRRQAKRAVLGARAILLWALVFRIVLLLAGLPTDTLSSTWGALRDDLHSEVTGYQPFLLWDNDVWRYLWDGHVAAAELSPYRTPPQDVLDAADAGAHWAEELVEHGPWLDVLDSMSYLGHPTIYPPLALGLFRAAHVVAPGSVFVWKLQLAALEWFACVLFLGLLRATGRSDDTLVWIAWNPLLLKEVAGSGHLEGALILLLVATLLAAAKHRQQWAAAALAAATLLKLWPILLAPALLARARFRAWLVYGGGIAMGLLPWWSDLPALLDALRSFAGTWVFNPGVWLVFEAAAQALGAGERAGSWARTIHLGLTALTVLGLLVASRINDRRPAAERSGADLEVIVRDWLSILAVYLLLAPTVMPWYLTVVLPVAAMARFAPWHAVTAASILSYLIYVLQEESPAVLLVEHTIIAVALLLWTRRRARPSLRAQGAEP